jgi:DNA invertase Pin-like site-specific DNA recombinase
LEARVIGQRVGYTRVSSLDQNPDRQLEEFGVSRETTYQYLRTGPGAERRG